MNTVLALLSIQALLGAFDNLWHHEWQARLPQRASARHELRLHAAREAIYGLVFLALGWCAWLGLWAWLLGALLLTEVGITMADFLEEDRTRRLPPFERWLHTLLTLSYGLFLGLFWPILTDWSQQPTAVQATPRGALSWLFTAFGIGVLAWSLRNLLAVRRLGSGSATPPPPPARGPAVLITGATGFIGRRLVARLQAQGRRLILLSRDPQQARAMFGDTVWVVDDLRVIPAETRIDAIVNLAGARVLGLPWSAARRRLLLASRVGPAQALLALARRLEQAPRVLVTASAVGFYGAHGGDEYCHEDMVPPASGEFQTELCIAIEHEAKRFEAVGMRVLRLRFGVVLGGDDGAYPLQALASRLGFGAVLGSGAQFAPWIHVDDALGLIEHGLAATGPHGALNAVAPEAICQREFARQLAASFGRRLWLRLPAAPLRLLAGEMSDLLLAGQRVSAERALSSGYRFRHPTLRSALAALAA